jgi:hypothetical protein
LSDTAGLDENFQMTDLPTSRVGGSSAALSAGLSEFTNLLLQNIHDRIDMSISIPSPGTLQHYVL